MRLIVTRSDTAPSQLRFATGPIYIGRHMHSQVFLPEPAVSRRHAVIYVAEGKWVVEDLDSANKTFLNDRAIHKSQLNDGDIIRIADFSIEVRFDEAPQPAVSVEMDDTRITVRHDVATVVRTCTAKEGPPLQLPAKRIRGFSMATRQLCRATSLEQLHAELLDVLHSQFVARDAWAALRKTAAGPMDCQGGRRMSSEIIKRSDLIMQAHIAEAMEKHKCVLVPQIPREIAQGMIRSAIVVPVMRDKDCCGALYADNSRDHEHYTMADLDYLLLIAIHTAAVMQRL